MTITHESIKPNTILPIRIFDFKSQSVDRVIYEHWHKSTEILYCVYGSLNVWLNGKLQRLVEGEVMFINENIVHSSQSPSKNHVIVMQIPEDTMQSLSLSKYGNEIIVDLVRVKDEIISASINEIFLGSSNPTWVNLLRIQVRLYELFTYIFDQYSITVNKEEALSTQKYLDRLNLVTAYIKDNSQYDLSLEEIAEKFDLTPHYFARFFKKYMGSTFLEYLTRVRLDQAFKLLLSTDMTISDISYDCGFKNPKSFYSSFKKYYKTTPSMYKKSINDTKEDKIIII